MITRVLTVVSSVAICGLGFASAAAAPAKAHGTSIAMRTSSHGKVLDGAGGKYVYVHVTPTGKDVPCTGQCPMAWPAVSTNGKPQAGAGVRAAHLGQTAHHVVTYYGHPLYYFSYDIGKASIGDGISSFGGKWHLISAAGKSL